MHRSPSSTAGGSRRYRGSALLSSSVQRMARVLLAVLFLWMLTGWAMGWW
ncbi:hypothetical protein RE432_07030 [Pusillimonas sp. SM2304]|nr:hypothetical protein [Pusillimonas sp. SM2304]MDS1140186.1 hypothetical protein [Pusillimonas sp. SM2304]